MNRRGSTTWVLGSYLVIALVVALITGISLYAISSNFLGEVNWLRLIGISLIAGVFWPITAIVLLIRFIGGVTFL